MLAVDDTVTGVVDEWLANFSSGGKALSRSHERLIVGHLLFVRSGKRSVSDIISTTDPEIATRIVATGFVLFVQEYLRHGRDSVFGFDVDFVTDFLAEMGSHGAGFITIDAIAQEVISVDQDGAASTLVDRREFATMFRRDINPRYSSRQLMLAPIAESGSIEAAAALVIIPGAKGDVLESSLRCRFRETLATRYAVAVAGLSSLFTCFTLEYDGGNNGMFDLLALSGTFIIGFSVLSGLFPTDKDMCTSGRLVLTLSGVTDFAGNCYRGWAEWSLLPPHASMLSAAVHATALLFYFFSGAAWLVLASRGRLTWGRFLAMLSYDGAAYFTTCALLHALGPLPQGMTFCYPPGSLSMSVAALRALVQAVLVPAAFCESNRLKIARLTGFTHVRIQLKELQGYGATAEPASSAGEQLPFLPIRPVHQPASVPASARWIDRSGLTDTGRLTAPVATKPADSPTSPMSRMPAGLRPVRSLMSTLRQWRGSGEESAPRGSLSAVGLSDRLLWVRPSQAPESEPESTSSTSTKSGDSSTRESSWMSPELWQRLDATIYDFVTADPGASSPRRGRFRLGGPLSSSHSSGSSVPELVGIFSDGDW